jgi:thiamine kinase-like enzyme
MNKIYQDFLWSIWTIIKEAKGDDFGTYGMDRFNRARNNLNNDLIMEMTYEYKK